MRASLLVPTLIETNHLRGLFLLQSSGSDDIDLRRAAGFTEFDE